MKRAYSIIVGLCLVLSACAPSKPVEFRSVRNVVVDADDNGEPRLRGEAVFYNPNNTRMKLKEIKMEVFVDGKSSATVDQKPDLEIPANAEFTASVEAHLSFKELGLVDAMLSLFGGKKYEVQYVGYVRVKVHGITVKIPVKFTDQLRLK